MKQKRSRRKKITSQLDDLVADLMKTTHELLETNEADLATNEVDQEIDVTVLETGCLENLHHVETAVALESHLQHAEITRYLETETDVRQHAEIVQFQENVLRLVETALYRVTKVENRRQDAIKAALVNHR